MAIIDILVGVLSLPYNRLIFSKSLRQYIPRIDGVSVNGCAAFTSGSRVSPQCAPQLDLVVAPYLESRFRCRASEVIRDARTVTSRFAWGL